MWTALQECIQPVFKVHVHWSKAKVKAKFFSLIFVADQYEYYIGFFMNPSGNDVAFALEFAFYGTCEGLYLFIT